MENVFFLAMPARKSLSQKQKECLICYAPHSNCILFSLEFCNRSTVMSDAAINALADASAHMNKIQFEKTVRRKLTEIGLTFWGVIGGFACLYIANQAFQFEMEHPVAQTPLSSPIPVAIMYTLVWIGGLIFLGFFALLSPMRMVAIPNQLQNFASGEAFEEEKSRTVPVGSITSARRAKAA
jgi:CDP-diglyceride synthetase